MSHTQDCIHAVTGTQTNDGLLAHYQAYGATSNDIDDAEREFLIANGATPAHENDMWLELLVPLLGYTASLPDLLRDFWCNYGGVFTPPDAPLFDGTIATQNATNLINNTGIYDASVHFTTGGYVNQYALVNAPAWMTISNRGIISAFPAPDAAADYTNIQVSGNNITGPAALSNTFTLSVTANAPVFAGGPVPAIEVVDGQAITPPISSSQYFTTGGPVATYSLTNKPAWLNIDAVTGELTGTPVLGQDSVGTTINATNVDGTDSSNAFTVTVQSSVAAPEFTGLPIPAITGEVGTPITPYNVAANSHFTGTSITYTMTGQPAGIEITPAGTIQGTPTVSGNVSGLIVTASNAGGSDASLPFNALIDVTTVIPVYQDSAVATNGTTFNIAYDVNVVGSTGFTFTRDAGAPETLTGGVVSNNLITFSGVSPAILQGEVILLSYTAGDVVSVASGDPAANFSNQSTTNNSTETGLAAPIFLGDIANQTSTVGTPFSLDVSGSFSTGGAVATYSLQNNPVWMSIDNAGLITGTPDVEAITAGITVTGTNATDFAVSNAWQMDAQAGGVVVPLFSRPYSETASLEDDATYARGSTGTVVDFEGVVRTALENESRFEGANRLEDLFTDTTTTLANGAATTAVNVEPGSYVFSMGAGSGTATVSGTATGATGTRDADAANRTALALTITGAGTIIVTASAADLADIMLQDKTGSSTPTIPDDYVSVQADTGVYGPDIVVNGDCSSSTGWILIGTDLPSFDGRMNWDTSGAGESAAIQNVCIPGEFYRLTFDHNFSSISGLMRVYLANTSSSNVDNVYNITDLGFTSAEVTFKYINSQALKFVALNTAVVVGWIDNVKLTKIHHGAGVDGVKYSTFDNSGNSVDPVTGIVTEAQGAPLSGISLLMEPAGDAFQNNADDLSGGADTIDLTTGGTGDFTLWVTGTAAVTVAAGTATGTGFGQATAGSPVTFNLTVTGTITLTLDSGSLDTLPSGNANYQVETGALKTSLIECTGTPLSRAIDELDYTAATEIPALNETRAVEKGANVDVDDWDKVVDTQLDSDADGILELTSIDVYNPGERPA